jgi:hypothetical protein
METMLQVQGRIYGCGGPRAFEIWRPQSVTTNLDDDISSTFVLASHND